MIIAAPVLVIQARVFTKELQIQIDVAVLTQTVVLDAVTSNAKSFVAALRDFFFGEGAVLVSLTSPNSAPKLPMRPAAMVHLLMWKS